jgi:hypothetical protein
MGIGKKMMWGLAASTATRAARAGTRRALHTRYGAPRLPRPAKRRGGLSTALMWAAGAGIVLALADVFKEQKKMVREREAAH